MDSASFLYWVALAAVAINALTGVIEAARHRIDLVGAIFIALATALAGGTLRDLLLDRNVFWIADQTYLTVAFLTGLASFFVLRRRAIPADTFLYPDAVGLALFTVAGTQIALQWEAPWLVASLLGVATGVFGGVARDLLCNQVPLVMQRSELYATASWIGALTVIGLHELGVDPVVAGWAGMAVALVLRMAAIRFRITLPTLGA
jgi:uncharacterized membrane protein YeiH